MSPTGLVPGLHCGGELVGLCSRDAPHQVANRAQRQVELPGNVRGVGPEPRHASQSQPYVGIRRAPLKLTPKTRVRIHLVELYQARRLARNLVSGLRTELSVG